MNPGVELCLGVRAWSVGTRCGGGLNLTTWTKLIRTVEHRQPSVSASSSSRPRRTVSNPPAVTIRHLSPCLFPGNQLHRRVRVSLTVTWDPFTSVGKATARAGETDTSAARRRVVIRADQPDQFNTLSHRRPPAPRPADSLLSPHRSGVYQPAEKVSVCCTI